jgi:hypothetical protein
MKEKMGFCIIEKKNTATSTQTTTTNLKKRMKLPMLDVKMC